MTGLLGYLISYLIGGITFIPLVIFAILYNQKREPESVDDRNKQDLERIEEQSLNNGEPVGYRDLKGGEIEDKENLGKKTTFEGWLTVTREFYKFTQINPDEFKTNVYNAEVDVKSIDNNGTNGFGTFGKIMKKELSNIHNTDEEQHDVDDTQVGAAKLRQIRKKNRFYSVIKHGNLFMYTDETQKNLKHAIPLEHYFVTLWPRGLTDGQLFTKRTAICLIKKDEFSNDDELKAFIEVLHAKTTVALPKSSYYLYGDTTIQKEDWYFAFIRATSSENIPEVDKEKFQSLLDPTIMAKTLHFYTADMLELIETINSTEHQIHMKWLNALIGRLFLATYQTESFKAAFADKIEAKLKKIKTPGFLDQLQIKRTDVGHAAPTFTNPKLKSLSPDGDLEVLINMQYHGKAMVEIATKLLLNIGFKQREFDIVVKMVVEKLDGELLIKIKPQPSNRIWYTFTKMPELDVKIEPLFSSRNLSYGIITSALQSKLREAVKTSAVYPFFDDFVFYKTNDEIFRGGIFDKSIRVPATSTSIVTNSDLINTVRSESNHSQETDSIMASSLKPTEGSLNSKQSYTQLSEFTTPNMELESSDTTKTPEILEKVDDHEDNSSRTSEQIKGTVIKSYSKIKQWYKKTPIATSTEYTTGTNISRSSTKDYNPPEMISNRRRKGSKTERFEGTITTPTSTSSSFQLETPILDQRASGEAFISMEQRNVSKSTQNRYGSISSLEGLNFNHSSPLVATSPRSPSSKMIDEKDEIDSVEPSFLASDTTSYTKRSIIGPTSSLLINPEVNKEQSLTRTLATSVGMTNEALDRRNEALKSVDKNFKDIYTEPNSVPKSARSMKRKPPPPVLNDDTNSVTSSINSQQSDGVE
ncbi:hypothetical protein CANINC_004140 [Pichia inconspicua]|uniref:SMP-LTD domain-containing protein n=1 Tax=Pichia inconspicua TaxID=52247 RepID=A0A4T0WYC3_9ASCO|nr:hypothetical protein CANINC_004140 [[Candida] inconspicua]